MVSASAVPLVDLQTAAGVEHLAGVWRSDGVVNLESSQRYPEFELLAIEPDSFAQVTTYRQDFAEEDMETLLGGLAVAEGKHPALLPLPGQPARFGLWLWGWPEDKGELDSHQRWIRGNDDAERVGVVAKLQSAQGELFTAHLQRPETVGRAATLAENITLRMEVDGRDLGMRVSIRPDNQGWHYFESSLPILPPSSYPLQLHSLWFQNRATRLGEPIAKGVYVVLDDLIVVDAETQEVRVVEDFESADRTHFLNTMDGLSIYAGVFTEIIDQFGHSGTWAQEISMAFMRPGQVYPLRLRRDWISEPLPALASPAFLETTSLQVGDMAQALVNSMAVDFRIVGETGYFPTMYEELPAGFLVTSRDLLLALFNETSQSATNPNEVLLETDGDVAVESLSPLVPLLAQSWQVEDVRTTLKANPLALGLRSVTFFGSLLTLLLGFVGFTTYFYMSVRQREVHYGVIRALGMSPRQLYGSIILEQAILILTGLILGTALGLLLNRMTLPRLPVSLSGRQPIPPLITTRELACYRRPLSIFDHCFSRGPRCCHRITAASTHQSYSTNRTRVMTSIWRHLRRYWRLNLGILLCLTLASVLLVGLSSYAHAVATRALQQTLTNASAVERSLLITGTRFTFSEDLSERLHERLGPVLRSV